MYEAFYGLESKPFRLSPDFRFYYESRGHKRAMAYLKFGLEQGEGFIVITGGIGTGKTTLVETLLNSVKRDNLLTAKIVNSQLDADNLLYMVAAAFGLPYESLDKTSALKRIEKFLIQKAWEGKRALLIVDEAQNLPRSSLEELRMLSNMHVAGVPLIQTFLLGQDEFLKVLNAEDMEQLRQRVAATHRLTAMGPDEIQSYIEHRLRLVGWDGDPEFEKGVYDEIYKQTGGVPRKINTFCDRLMLYGYLEELHRLDAGAAGTVAQEFRDEQGQAAIEPQAEMTGERRQKLEDRLRTLEGKVNELEDALILERGRLRAISLKK